MIKTGNQLNDIAPPCLSLGIIAHICYLMPAICCPDQNAQRVEKEFHHVSVTQFTSPA